MDGLEHDNYPQLANITWQSYRNIVGVRSEINNSDIDSNNDKMEDNATRIDEPYNSDPEEIKEFKARTNI